MNLLCVWLNRKQLLCITCILMPHEADVFWSQAVSCQFGQNLHKAHTISLMTCHTRGDNTYVIFSRVWGQTADHNRVIRSVFSSKEVFVVLFLILVFRTVLPFF